MYTLRIITILTAIFLITSCATTYTPPESGKSALVVIPKKEFSWKFFGSDGAQVQFAIKDETGCGKVFKEIQPKNEQDNDVEIRVPANKEIFVKGNYIIKGRRCVVAGSFLAHEGLKYKVTKLGSGLICGIRVDVNENGARTPVKLKRAKITPLNKICSLESKKIIEPLDKLVVGTWQGVREKSHACQALSWVTKFDSNGRFEIAFFKDKERTKFIKNEYGSWKTHDGENILKTDGVEKADVYSYKVIDEDTIKYVNTERDPSGDCQAEYEFTEYRIKN